MKKIYLFALASIFLLIPFATFAVYFASDTVTLSSGGNRITDDKTLWAADYGYGGTCPNGVCDIGQQFYPVTIYRLKTTDIQAFGEYQETPGSKQGVEFHKYLKSNSLSQFVFRPPASKGGEGCGSANCMGGRIGDARDISLDIKTHKFTIGGVEGTSPINYFTWIIVGMAATSVIGITSFVIVRLRKAKLSKA